MPPLASYSGGICSVHVYRSVRHGVRVPWKVVDVSSKEVPEPWASRMVERQFTDPRYATDIPSLSRLAETCGMHTSTISSAIKGTGRTPSAGTVVALTEALGEDVADWLGAPRVKSWELPAEASLLTDRQQKAVVELIKSMTEQREEVGSDDRSAPTKRAGQAPANVKDLRAVEDTATLEELAGYAADTDRDPAPAFDDQSDPRD